MPLNISDISVQELVDPKFVRPFSISFTLEGKRKVWECVRAHASVTIIVYNASRKTLVFVKQFRPAVYLLDIPETEQKGTIDTNKYPLERGFTLEFCAGIIDKNKPVEEIAREEILEECGYDVPLSKLEKISVLLSTTGINVHDINFFYAEVVDNMKISEGGGLKEEDEYIEVIELSIPEVQDLLKKSKLELVTAYGIQWFFVNKYKPSAET